MAIALTLDSSDDQQAISEGFDFADDRGFNDHHIHKTGTLEVGPVTADPYGNE